MNDLMRIGLLILQNKRHVKLLNRDGKMMQCCIRIVFGFLMWTIMSGSLAFTAGIWMREVNDL